MCRVVSEKLRVYTKLIGFERKIVKQHRTTKSELQNNTVNKQAAWSSTKTTTKRGGGELVSVTDEGVLCLREDALIPVHHAGLRPDVPLNFSLTAQLDTY